VRWTTLVGSPNDTIRVARTMRRRLVQVPGRLTRSARQWMLHLPARWAWQDDFIRALARIRALPPPPDPQPAASTSSPPPRRAPRRALIAALKHPPNRRCRANSPNPPDPPGAIIRRRATEPEPDRYIKPTQRWTHAYAESRRCPKGNCPFVVPPPEELGPPIPAVRRNRGTAHAQRRRCYVTNCRGERASG
jgi:hypothetical protein